MMFSWLSGFILEKELSRRQNRWERLYCDRRTKVEQKAAMWLDLGAKAVWLVNPKRRTIEVIHANGNRWHCNETDELVDDTVPGFRVAVSEIFA
jgi:Uma2 family endonuclease